MRRFWQRITQKRRGFIKQGFSMVVHRNVHIPRQKQFTYFRFFYLSPIKKQKKKNVKYELS